MKILKIYSNTCGPCKVLTKNLEEAQIPYEGIDVESDDGLEIAQKYKVKNLPTLLMIDDSGNIIKSHTGILTVKDLQEWK